MIYNHFLECSAAADRRGFVGISGPTGVDSIEVP